MEIKTSLKKKLLFILPLSFLLLTSCGGPSIPTSINSGSDETTTSSDSTSSESSLTNTTSNDGHNLATSFALNQTEEVVISKGKTSKLGYTLYPSNAEDTITWTTSDPHVATVDENGVVTGISSGVAFINAKTENNLNSRCEVTVNDLSIKSGLTTSDIVFSGVDPETHVANSLMDASNFISLAIINRYKTVSIKFNFNNTTTKDDFISYYLELDTMCSISATSYKTGTNITNTFSNSNYGMNLSYIHTTTTSALFYEDITFGNNAFRNQKLTRRASDYDDFPLMKSNKGSLNVINSEELWWAVNHNYIPKFPVANSKAESFYNQAKSILREIVTDDMSDFEKTRAMYEWITSSTIYDYKASETADYDNTCYFLEGVFEYRVAVCDSFSKTLALLGGLENLNLVRAFGFDTESGHAWNYVNLDSKWYLLCPTWGDEVFEDGISKNIYDTPISFTSYDAFLTKATYFKQNGFNCTQKIYPETLTATSKYLNICGKDKVSDNVDFYIESKDELSSLLLSMEEANIYGNYYLIMQDASSFVTTANVKSAMNEANIHYEAVNVTTSTLFSETYKTVFIRS